MQRREFLALAPAAALGQTPEKLFDGATLNGWTIEEGPQSAFYVQDGSIVVHEGSNFPAWLRSNRRFENFDFRCEFFVRGWMNSGLFLCAPRHGRATEAGLKINIFHKAEPQPLAESMGAVFPVVAPRKVNVRGNGQWNTLRVRLDWPSLQVWVNEEPVQDLNCDHIPELRHRLRDGYIGFESLSYPIRFRNISIETLPSKLHWDHLYRGPADLAQWVPHEKAKWETLGEALRADGLGYLATRKQYRDFEFQCYIRHSKHSNGGILFRCGPEPRDPHYEIQLHDVEGAVYPTGSLYGYQRARYPRVEPEQWYPFQLIVRYRTCIVRVNGDTVAEYDKLERTGAGPLMLQAHQTGRWIEYKEIRVRELA